MLIVYYIALVSNWSYTALVPKDDTCAPLNCLYFSMKKNALAVRFYDFFSMETGS